MLTDVYGNCPPRAAEFSKGATDLAQVKNATDARREVPPGVYGTNKR